MAERVGHEFGDHKLGHVTVPAQSPLLQRDPGEVSGGLGRLGPRAQLAGCGEPVYQVAGIQICQGQRPTLDMDPVMPACRQEPVVAHASALRPNRRNELRVTRVPCNFMRSDLSVPQCKRYHPPCKLQAQGLMHVHLNLALARAGRHTAASWCRPLDHGFRRGLR